MTAVGRMHIARVFWPNNRKRTSVFCFIGGSHCIMSLNKRTKLEEPVEAVVVPETIQARFVSDAGEEAGPPLDLPTSVNISQLAKICNAILQNDEAVPYLFFVNDKEVAQSLEQSLDFKKFDHENVISIVYQPQANFVVRSVTRCTSTMPGHAEAVVAIHFSSDGRQLASGSGDTTIRLWDLTTETPLHTCTGHRQWVLCVAWSPDSKRLASACKNGEIRVWDPATGQQCGKPMVGHKKWINCLHWEPYHLNAACRRLASAGSDGDIRIWDVVLSQCVRVLTSHTGAVTSVRWGGLGLLYTSSKDRTIKMWRAEDGALCRTLTGHAHWVNNLTLNTDYVLRTGPYYLGVHDDDAATKARQKSQSTALQRYKEVCPDGVESFVSCSDDFTLYLWRSDQSKCITRMTGHQNVVNDVKYSPDVKLIASASFDKSVRLWRASDGAFINTFRGHVQAVYSVAWSVDSRLLVTGSKDSTLKVWSVKDKKLKQELPGHADEVFAIDWSPDGARVASGGKDKVIKLWAY